LSIKSYKNHRHFNRLNEARVDVFSNLITASRVDTVSVTFEYGLSERELILDTQETGTIVEQDAMALISTGEDVNGFASMRTKRNLRYVAGHEGFAQFTLGFTTGENGKNGIENANQLAGLFNDDNGYMIGFLGERFCVIRRRAGTDYITYQEDFNRDNLNGGADSEFDMIFSNSNLFRIRFGWLGASVIIYETMTNDGEWIEFHRENYPNSEPMVSIIQPVLPVRYTVEKINADDTTIIMRTGSLNAGVVGEITRASERYFSASNLKDAIANVRNNIFTLRSKDIYSGRPNTIESIFGFISTVSDTGAQLNNFELVLNATLVGTPNWQDIEVDSTLEIDTQATTVEGGETVLQFGTRSTDSTQIHLRDFLISLFPNDTLSFVSIPDGNGDARMSTRWREEF